MHIFCLGLNHQTAPIALRERLAFNEDDVRAALSHFSGEESSSIIEMVILSTCNRIELYAVSTQAESHPLETFLSEARYVPIETFRPYLYTYRDAQAVEHLLNVSAGLDSLVLGEPQILGQVTNALLLARDQKTTGSVLNRLFQVAIHAGKRARTETAISRYPASVSSLAVNLCERSFMDLRAAQVVVLGAGEMAELAIKTLRKRGVTCIQVINRTLERARDLAERWDIQFTAWEKLGQAVMGADILIASTSAPHTVLQAETVQTAMQKRSDRPLTLFDIAVPRDIDPAVGEIPGVKLYDIDQLNGKLEVSFAARRHEVPQVEAILAEETTEFMSYFQSFDMLPIITNLRQQAEEIRKAELQKTLRRLPDLTESERARIEALTEALVKKLLAQPTLRLRAEAGCQHASEYAVVARTLFGLEITEGSCIFSGESCPIGCSSE